MQLLILEVNRLDLCKTFTSTEPEDDIQMFTYPVGFGSHLAISRYAKTRPECILLLV
jgi:hypothetical protein